MRTDAIAATMLEMIDFHPNMKALEFGSGTGLLSFVLKDQFSEITLMYSSVEMNKVVLSKIADAQTTHNNPLFFYSEKNNYNVGTFDMIFTQMSLHHVKDIEAILDKFYNLLNPFGIIAIADLYKEDGTFHDFKFDGHFGFDPVNLVEIMGKSGFSNIKYKTCFTVKKIDIKNNIREYPIFLIVAEKNKILKRRIKI